ncbi:MAG: shikimate dehydrogenase [Lentisphaeria bacterium]|nr:shikimate dehydrogenase [Candidatus Neomarinimicrobiota bacterium]MCF7842713.1 shikimate dehydrogenase [Lentisphaeria bacterium]
MRFGIIGNPLKQSVSPFLIQLLFEKLGYEVAYKKYEVPGPDLREWIRGRAAKGLDGFNVTIPLKTDIIPLLDDVNARSAPMKAVNVVRKTDGKWVGYNTDWYGFVKAVEINSVDLKDANVVILGAGGAARAIAYGAAKLGAKRITIVARSLPHGVLLVKDLKQTVEPAIIETTPWDANAIEPIEQAYMLVNATPIGMKPNIRETPLDAELLENASVVMDAVYNPINTHLLADALMADCQTIPGLDMFLYQAMAAVDVWLGEEQDWKAVNLDEVRELTHNKITGFKRKDQ